jgi:hypothetical protein
MVYRYRTGYAFLFVAGFPDDSRTAEMQQHQSAARPAKRPAAAATANNGPTAKFGRPANLKMFLVAPGGSAERGQAARTGTAEPQVSLSEPQVSLSKPQVSFSEPQVSFSEPQVSSAGICRAGASSQKYYRYR